MTSTSTFFAHQLLRALQEIARRRRAQRRTRKRPCAVLGRVRVFQLLLDVLDGDQALQVVVVVHYQQLLDAVLVQDRPRACSSVVPTETVMRFSFVITAETGRS